MISTTISGKAYGAIAPILPAGLVAEKEIPFDGESHVWLPRAAVERLRALREPGETFSDITLRLAERGSYAAITR